MNQAKLLIFTDSNIYSSEFANIWRARGFDLQHLPLLYSENINFDLQSSDSYCGIVITSSNAIFALKKYFENKHIRIYTISAALAEKIKAAGYQNVCFEINGKDANSLKTIFNQYPPQGKVLHLCGARLRKQLEFDSLNIQSVPVYRMVAIQTNVEKIRQITDLNMGAAVYVSSEQAIEILSNGNLRFEQIIFKSDYLQKFAKKFF